MAPQKILIVGCGVAGPTLATFLLMPPTPASERPHITILERAPTMRAEGQNVDLRGAGATVMRKLGIEAQVRAATTGEVGNKMVTSSNWTYASMAADTTGETQTPTSDIEILRGRLAEILYNRSLEQSDKNKSQGGKPIEFIFGDSLAELQQDEKSVTVKFAKSNNKRSFDLVVAADGLLSTTRKLAYGAQGEHERIYSLDMYGAFFSMPVYETDSAWRRWWHTTGRRGIMVRPSSESDKTTAFVHVISDTDERFKQVAEGGRASIDSQKELLHEYFDGSG